jgi:hypothetical protein
MREAWREDSEMHHVRMSHIHLSPTDMYELVVAFFQFVFSLMWRAIIYCICVPARLTPW